MSRSRDLTPSAAISNLASHHAAIIQSMRVSASPVFEAGDRNALLRSQFRARLQPCAARLQYAVGNHCGQKGWPGANSPSNVRKTGRTGSDVRESVTIMSVIGWASVAISSTIPTGQACGWRRRQWRKRADPFARHPAARRSTTRMLSRRCCGFGGNGRGFRLAPAADNNVKSLFGHGPFSCGIPAAANAVSGGPCVCRAIPIRRSYRPLADQKDPTGVSKCRVPWKICWRSSISSGLRWIFSGREPRSRLANASLAGR